MKKIYLLLIMFFCFSSRSNVIADELIINNVIITPGGMVEVPLNFKAAIDAVNVGFTLNLILPDGITTVKDEDGVPEYVQNTSVLNKFTVITTENDGFAAIPQTTSATINGTEGTLLTFQLLADEALDVGTKLTATVTKAAFTAKDADGKMFTVNIDDFTFKISVVSEDYNPSIISFSDPVVKSICVTNWDTDGDGELSEVEAAAVSDLGTVFKGNTEINAFEELNYFTGLSNICSSSFSGCSCLTNVTIPNSVTIIGDDAFVLCI